MFKYYVLAICLCMSFELFSQEKQKVVIGSSSGDEVAQNIRSTFMNALTSGLTNSGRFDVLASHDAYTKALGEELRIQSEGYINEDQLLELGKADGADYVISANIDAIDDQFLITFKMIELKTRRTIPSTGPIIATRSELISKAQELAISLANGYVNVGRKVEEPKEEVAMLMTRFNGKKIQIDKQDKSASIWEEADRICKAKGEGWRLPTIDELKFIYQQRDLLIGNPFKRTTYWSSSLRNNFSIYAIDFSDGTNTYVSKTSQSVYRCVCPE